MDKSECNSVTASIWHFSIMSKLSNSFSEKLHYFRVMSLLQQMSSVMSFHFQDNRLYMYYKLSHHTSREFIRWFAPSLHCPSSSLYSPDPSYPRPHFHICKLLENDKSEQQKRRIL